jgi:competence protein ComEC
VWCYARTSKVTVVNAPVRPCIADLAADWRQQLNQRLVLAMPGKNPDLYARLLGAIVYGASLEDLPEDIVELYRRTGTIHVLVVSGSQVSLLVVVLLTLSRGRRRSVRAHHLILVVPAAFLYATLCGREPSIMRAAALAFVLVSGLHAARPYDLPTALAFVGVILVLAEPADLFTPGLQLTFAACVGVAMAVRLLPAPREKCAFPARLAYGIAAILCGTLGAWVMTTPILAYDFGAVAITGNLANALVVPLSSIALIFGLPGTFLALANPMLATGPLWFCRYALAISVAINAWCARLPAAFAEALHPTPIMVAAWYLAVGAAYLLARHGGRTGKIYAVIAGPAALVALLLLMAAPPHRTCVTVTWLDVGEGLATVIETPDGHFALFDAGSRDPDLRGPRAARQVLLPYLRSRGCRRISAVVLSHADVDHFNAVSMLAERLRIDRVIVSPNGSGKEYEQLLTELAGAGTEVVAARVGASVHLGRAAFLHFLHPQPYVVGGGSDNDNCLVAMLESGKHRVLMTGDIEAEGQWELLRAVGQTHLRADVLQVPHHARKSAFLGTFLDAVKPELAVAPTGPAYLGGEPDPRFADYFAARGAAFAETASSGAVTAILSPAGIVWRPFLSSPPSQFFASPHNRQVQ